MVQPGVFSPKNTISTKVFLDFISTLDLTDKNILELGAGSGIIALQSAFQGAHVTASDINQVAIKSIETLSKHQDLKITTVISNVLNDLNGNDYDYIFINPPYYPKNPANLEENAWFCGENFDFFEKMLSQFSALNTQKTIILMILSDACDLPRIAQIASTHSLTITEEYSIKLTFETNTIYRVQ
jgi:release factor glutamine methyltransferase